MLKASGRLATGRPLTVCFAWLILILVGFGVGSGVMSRMSSQATSVRGSESARANDWLDRLGGGSTDTVTGVVPGDAAALRARIEQAVQAVRQVPNVVSVPDPYTTKGLVAADGRAVLIPVTLNGKAHDHDYSRVEDLLHAMPSAKVSGGPLLSQELNGEAKHDLSRAEMLSLPIVLLLMILVFRGFRAAALPLVLMFGGVAGSLFVLYLVSLGTSVSSASISVTTMLGLGLAVDYGLLIVSRFREERGAGFEVPDAVRRTVVTAGRTVMFSGLTVAACLSGLLFFPAPALRSIGIAAASVIVVDMLAAVTLLPALLTRFGRRIKPGRPAAVPRVTPSNPAGSTSAWGTDRSAGVGEPLVAKGTGPEDRSVDQRAQAGGASFAKRTGGEGGFFAAVAGVVSRRPLLVALPVVLVLLVLALPVTGMKLADADARSLPAHTEARQTYDLINAHFPAIHQADPIVVTLRPGASPDFAAQIGALPGVTAVRSSVYPDGTRVLRLTPTGPSDGPVADRLVSQIRRLRGDQPVMVSGTAAHMNDYRAMLADRLPLAVGLVLVAILVLLFAFTGSVVVPLRTVASTLLSLGAALGVVVWIFQDGHLASLFGTQGVGALNAPMPPIIIAIAFGLAMDYEIFILGRMRETWQATGDATASVTTALARTGRVVTSAALLLVVVFACFMTGGYEPVLEVGLGLTLAVLIDATVVRMLLVPATMALLGRTAWWAPRPLRRLHDRFGIADLPAMPEPSLSWQRYQAELRR
jgi:RND superfamily putative drug exporter